MLVAIEMLAAEEVAEVRCILQESAWVDGKVTAGEQAAIAKLNLQIPADSPAAKKAGDIILRALGRNAIFYSAALPLRVPPPMFNRYDVGMKFDAHVDGAIRAMSSSGLRMRADISSTLFLTPAEDYDGGELIISDTYGDQRVKLPAGHIVIYPTTSLHSVTPITRGSRWASFFWTQSMVRDDGQRAMLYELDVAIRQTRELLPDDNRAVVGLTSHYHNLLRRWADL